MKKEQFLAIKKAKNVDAALEKVFKALKKDSEKTAAENEKIIDAAIVELFWDTLGGTYKAAIEYLKRFYSKADISAAKVDLLNLLYDDTDEDRIRDYINQYIQDDRKDVCFFNLSRIFNFEAAHLFEYLCRDKMKDFCSHIKIVRNVVDIGGENECGNCPDGSYLISEIDPPPYHPNCTCTVEYIMDRLDGVTENYEDDGDLLDRII